MSEVKTGEEPIATELDTEFIGDFTDIEALIGQNVYEDEIFLDELPETICQNRVNTDTLDKSVFDLESESNQRYADIVEKIVKISDRHLDGQNKKKQGLRKILSIFFIALLSFQILAVIVFITLSAIVPLPFVISDYLLTVFITSVFVETLGAVSVMIGFAFASKDEVTVIELLTAIVNNYQKYKHNDTDSRSSKEK